MDTVDFNNVLGILVTGATLLTLCIVLGLIKLCCRSSHSDPQTKVAYPVAISNRLFNVRSNKHSQLHENNSKTKLRQSRPVQIPWWPLYDLAEVDTKYLPSYLTFT